MAIARDLVFVFASSAIAVVVLLCGTTFAIQFVERRRLNSRVNTDTRPATWMTPGTWFAAALVLFVAGAMSLSRVTDILFEGRNPPLVRPIDPDDANLGFDFKFLQYQYSREETRPPFSLGLADPRNDVVALWQIGRLDEWTQLIRESGIGDSIENSTLLEVVNRWPKSKRPSTAQAAHLAAVVAFDSFLRESSEKLRDWGPVVRGDVLSFQNSVLAVDELVTFVWPDDPIPNQKEIFKLTAVTRATNPVFVHRVAAGFADLSTGGFDFQCAYGERTVTTSGMKFVGKGSVGNGGGAIIEIPLEVTLEKGERLELTCRTKVTEPLKSGKRISGIVLDPRPYRNDKKPVVADFHFIFHNPAEYAISPRFDTSTRSFDITSSERIELYAEIEVLKSDMGSPFLSSVSPSPDRQFAYCVRVDQLNEPVALFFRRGDGDRGLVARLNEHDSVAR